MRIRINGVELYFDVEGAGLVRQENILRDRPTILALHGAGLDHAYLRPPLAPLIVGAQIVYMDLRGQGRSGPAPVETYTLEQMADDVAALCDALGIVRPILLGHSYGGFVALTAALRHPQLAAALILVNSGARIELAEALGNLERQLGAEARRVADDVLGRGNFSADALAEFGRVVIPAYTHPSTVAAFGDLTPCKASWDVPAQFFGKQRQHYDLRAGLARIEKPLLAIVGDYDWILPPSRSKEIVDAVAGAELAVIPEAGHFSLNERPAVFAAAVRRFLAKIDH